MSATKDIIHFLFRPGEEFILELKVVYPQTGPLTEVCGPILIPGFTLHAVLGTENFSGLVFANSMIEGFLIGRNVAMVCFSLLFEGKLFLFCLSIFV